MYAQLCTELSYALWWLVVHQFCGGRKVMYDQTSDSWFLFFMLLPHIVIFTCTVSIWRQAGLSVEWASRKMFELLNVCVFSLLFSDIQSLWHFVFVLMAYSFCAICGSRGSLGINLWSGLFLRPSNSSLDAWWIYGKAECLLWLGPLHKVCWSDGWREQGDMHARRAWSGRMEWVVV